MKFLSYLFPFFMGLMVSGCNNNDDDVLPGAAEVHVNVNNFSCIQEDIPNTRATQAIADYSGVKAITLAFFKSDGSKQYESTQLKTDETTYETFGSFSLTLPYGSYTMVVLGYGSEVSIVLNSKTSAEFGEEKSRETFVYTKEVAIDNTNAVNLDATLNRIVTRLTIQSTDNRPANAVAVRATLSKGGKKFDPMTGLATTDAGFSNTVEFSTAVGATTRSSTFFFLASDEETMDVTIETLDADNNVLFTKTMTDVPFKRNRATVLKGTMYSASTSGAFSVETTWLDDYNVDF